MNFDLPPPIPPEPRAPRPKGAYVPKKTASTDLPDRGVTVPPPPPTAKTSPEQSSLPESATIFSKPPSESKYWPFIVAGIGISIVIVFIVLASRSQRATYSPLSDHAVVENLLAEATPTPTSTQTPTPPPILTRDQYDFDSLRTASIPTPLPSPSATPLPADFSEAAKAFPGLWAGASQQVLFKPDGTWILNPELENANGGNGRWWIEGNRFYMSSNTSNKPAIGQEIVNLTENEIALRWKGSISRLVKTAPTSNTGTTPPTSQTYRVVDVSTGDYLNVRQGPGANYPVATSASSDK